MVSRLGARLGNHTSYQFCFENCAFGTPRGGRRTVPIRSPSRGARGVPETDDAYAHRGFGFERSPSRGANSAPLERRLERASTMLLHQGVQLGDDPLDATGVSSTSGTGDSSAALRASPAAPQSAVVPEPSRCTRPSLPFTFASFGDMVSGAL